MRIVVCSKKSIVRLALLIAGTLSAFASVPRIVSGETIQTSAIPVPPSEQYQLENQMVPGKGLSVSTYKRASPLAKVHVIRLEPSMLSRLHVIPAGIHNSRRPSRETTSSLCRQVRCVAAINGDYFEFETGLTTGPLVVGNELFHSQSSITHGLFALTNSNMPQALTTDELDWSVTLNTTAFGTVPIDGVNRPLGENLLTLYTPRYGQSTHTVPGTTELVAELHEGAGYPVGVTSLKFVALNHAGDTPLTAGQVIIAAQADAAPTLEALAAAVDATAQLAIEIGNTRLAVGGSPVLMRNGNYHFPWRENTSAVLGRRPRTLVGWTAANEMLLVIVDGDQPGYSQGINLPEAAQLLATLGAVEGIMLDGGSSSTMVVGNKIENQLSGEERAVASALVVLSEWGYNFANPYSRPLAQICSNGSLAVARFVDLDLKNPHSPAIACLLSWNVTQGETATIYAPNASVTRGQMATFISRFIVATGGDLPVSAPDVFADDDSSAHETSINQLFVLGVVQGFNSSEFRPDHPVTRAQMATFLARSWEVRTGGTLLAAADYFEDDSLNAHEFSINAIAGLGITAGTDGLNYSPDHYVRRDQMATFLARMFEEMVER